MDRYLFSLIDVYFAHFCRRIDGNKTPKLALWMRSTIQREAFSLSMIRARIVNEVYSASEISELINVSRQAVYQMIKDCAPEGWIQVYCDGQQIKPDELESCKGVAKYSAGNEMFGLGRAFVDRHIKEIDKSLLSDHWDDLKAFQQVKKALNE